MNPMGVPWTALMDMQPQRSLQTAWFVYGCIEREHVMNVNACANWWMRAIGLQDGRDDRELTADTVGAVLHVDIEHALEEAGQHQRLSRPRPVIRQYPLVAVNASSPTGREWPLPLQTRRSPTG